MCFYAALIVASFSAAAGVLPGRRVVSSYADGKDEVTAGKKQACVLAKKVIR